MKQIEGMFPQNVWNYSVSNKLQLIAFYILRDKYTNDLSIENDDNEKSDLFKIFCHLIKEKSSDIIFFKKCKILLKTREDVLNNLFPIMSDKTHYTTPRETSINEDSFINYIINNENV